MVFSNVSIYKEIVEEAYSKMCFLSDEGKTPKDDGSGGYIIKYDPTHSSFKQSMVVVVFTGMRSRGQTSHFTDLHRILA